MAPLPAFMGAMMALEVIREIVGFGEGLVGKLVLVDALNMRFETVRYRWDPANPLNGTTAATSRALTGLSRRGPNVDSPRTSQLDHASTAAYPRRARRAARLFASFRRQRWGIVQR